MTRYWWGMLLLGVAIFIAGILTLAYPGESYLSLTILFAILMLVSGAMQLVVAFTERYMSSRVWTAVLGALEVILGLVLLANPDITALMLPIILGIWLMIRGVGLIGIASEMSRFHIPGMVWTVILGVLLVICSLAILFQPLLFGMTAVVIWVGSAFLIEGATITIFAFQLFNLRNRLTRKMN